jgi:RNA polymerase sigma-70 factor, ECF subfamily
MSTEFAGPNGLPKGRKDQVDFEPVWIMAAKAGHARAFEELVTHSESRIYRLALNITQNRKDAEDLLQVTFIEAQMHFHELLDDSRYFTRLVQICIRESLKKFRERDLNWIGLDESTDSADDLVSNEMTGWGDCPEKHYEKSDLSRILSEAISKLSLIHRIVILLRDVESFSTVEIADLLGLSVQGTRSCLLRARLDARGYLNRYFNQQACADIKCGGSA